MSVGEPLKAKRGEILAIASRHGARSVRVFGSAARGEAGPESDLDLLVEMEPGRSLLDVVAIKQDVEDLTGRAVHVVTEAAISPYIRESVLEQATQL